MTRILKPLSFSKGEDWLINCDMFEPDDVTPLDLTGAEVSYFICKSATNKTPLVTLELNSGISLVGPAENGVIEINVDLAAHDAIKPGDYYHFCKVVTQDNRNTVQFEGPLTARPFPA